MRTAEHDGDRYLLVKSAAESSLIRDPETGTERYVPNDELTVTGTSPLITAAASVPEPYRKLLTAVHSEETLGLLLELKARGALSAREILGQYDLCESDLNGRLTELRAAGLIREIDVGGERGYSLTERGKEAIEGLNG